MIKETIKDFEYGRLERTAWKLGSLRKDLRATLSEIKSKSYDLGRERGDALAKDISEHEERIEHNIIVIIEAIRKEMEEVKWETCSECKGEGGGYWHEWEQCRNCNGSGKLRPQ
jgi:DnaJ-class molecular chaperone